MQDARSNAAGRHIKSRSARWLLLATAVVLAAQTGAQAPDEAPGLVDRDGQRIAAEAPRQLMDPHGRVIRDEHGQRRSYTREESEGLPRFTGKALPGAGKEPSLSPRNAMSVSLEWHRATYGVGIGDRGLHAADLDGDGTLEIVATAGPNDFFANDHWYVLRESGGEYPQVWARHQYTASLKSLQVADVDGDGDDEVLVGVGGDVLVYDGLDPVLIQTLSTTASEVRGLEVADVDEDGNLEAVFVDATRLFLVDLVTGAVDEAAAGFGGTDVAVGHVTGGFDYEIVVAAGSSSGWVLDGPTRAVHWENTAGFGDEIDLADVDGDGLDEVAAGFRWNDIHVWDGDTETVRYTVNVFNEFATLRFRDLGGATPDLVWADAQWGDVHAADGDTGTPLWLVDNPEHGVTGLEVADVDGDGSRELLWGAGFTSSGADFLFVNDAADGFAEWQSVDFGGPFRGFDAGDVDADGAPEIISGAFESESGSGDGLWFVHDAVTRDLEFTSPEPFGGSNLVGLWRVRRAQLDGDAAEEILVAIDRLYVGKVLVYDGASHALEREIDTESGLNVLGLEVADVDGDGNLEIIVSTGRQHTGASGVYVYVFDGASGAQEWRSPDMSGGSFADYPYLRVADVDGDGNLEIVTARQGGEVRVYDGVTHAEQLVTGDENVSSLDTPDRDGDGTAEIVIGDTLGLIEVLDAASGAVAETVGFFGGRIDGLAVADTNVDGAADYVFAVADEVRAVSGAGGAVLWASGDIGTGVGADDSLRVTDVDADGLPEIVVNLGPVGLRVYQIDQPMFNAPAVTVTAPAGGASFLEGETVNFTGVATDVEDGDLSAGLAWSSDLDGPIGTGTPVATSALSVGNHTVTAAVTDSLGLPGSDSVAVTVFINNPPVVTLIAPSTPLTVSEGGPVTLTATASDAEDGDLTGDIFWMSDLDGSLGGGGSIVVDFLSPGVHTITATVTDAFGASGEASETVTVDALPVVAITSPASGTTLIETESLSFTGSASDAEDGDLTAAIAWSSDLDGPIGAGGSFSTSALSVGSHTITATANDSFGGVGKAEITVVVNANTLPVVSIDTYIPGQTVFTDAELVVLNGTAIDAEDGDLSDSLAWSSDLDGALGTGYTLATSTLSLGTHTITAAVTDSHGGTGEDSLVLLIHAVPVVTITAPANGTVAIETDPVSFAGSASDAEDGDLTAGLAWSSDLDGPIGSGGSFTVSTLSVGSHTITASVTDSQGAEGSAAITVVINANTPPAVAITAPADGSEVTVGTAVTFTGGATDLEDGDLSAGLVWTSDADGTIGGGASFQTSALSLGPHTITAAVTDSHGAGGAAVISLLVRPQPVTVTLISIAADDGWVRESGENTDVGGTHKDGSKGTASLRAGDHKNDRQYKTIVSFDTSSIPDGATIVSATLRLRRGRVNGTNPFSTHGTCWIDVAGGSFGTSTELVNSDFEAAATAVQAASLGNAAANGDWSEGDLDSAGRAAVDATGTTQLRVYFALDDNDDGGNDYIGYYAADNSNPDNHPELVVTYQE